MIWAIWDLEEVSSLNFVNIFIGLYLPNTMPKKQSIKNQIRNIKRYLAKKGDSIEPAIKKAQEKKLLALEAATGDKIKNQKEQKLAKKYHRVKFFEKKKVLRKIKKAERAIREKAGDASTNQKALTTARDQLTYIEYYPKDKKYVSLFVFDQKEDPKKSANIRSRLLDSAKERKLREETEASTKANTTNQRDYDDDKTGGVAAEDKDDFFM